MTDRLDSMAILIAVVDAGSFSGAARRLATPLATVSRKVGELEKHLKIRLLLRSTRQLSLTEAGQSYVAACRRILDEVSQAERIATGEYTMPKGELVITAPVAFGRLHVLPMVAEFLKKYPDINVRLMLSDRTAHLLEDHIDVALRIGILPDSDLIAIPVGAVRTVVCASPEYFKLRGKPTKPEQLSQHDCVSLDVLTSAHSWRFGQGKSEINVPIHSRLVVNTAEAAVDAAIAGVGVTRLLSYQIAAAKRQSLLETVLESFEYPDRPVNLVHAGQGILPLKLRTFLDFGSVYLKRRLSEQV